MKKQNSELSAKLIRFCHEYVIDHNGKQAAIRTGYAARSAEVTASKLLRNAKVLAYISSLESTVNKTLEEKHHITKDRVLKELARIGLYDVRAIYDDEGALIPPSKWDDDTAAVIGGIEVYEERISGEKIGETKKVKKHDKIRALELICKMLGYNAPEKKEISGNVNLFGPETDLSALTEDELRFMSRIQKKLNV